MVKSRLRKARSICYRIIAVIVLTLFQLTEPVNGRAHWPLGKGIFAENPDTITSPFGPRTINGAYSFHAGFDLRTRVVGKPVYAAESGYVDQVNYNPTEDRPRESLRAFPAGEKLPRRADAGF